MTNQEAITKLTNIMHDDHYAWHPSILEAFRMAVDALKGADGDLISRQAAIDALHMHLMYRMGTVSNKKRLDEWINNLPSAQPEIIRCTECKHYREYDSKYVENAVVVQCMADRYPISETIPDGWFCAGAERKTDE